MEKMIKPSNYFKEIKKLQVSKFPPLLKEGYEFTKEVTEDNTTWEAYDEMEDIRSIIDEYLDRLNDFIEKKSDGNAKEVTPRIKEEEARETAKDLIRNYVKRGDSFQSIKSGQTGFSGDDFKASIKGDKIFVEEVNRIKSDWKFSLEDIYNELRQDFNMKSKSIIKKEEKSIRVKETPVKRPKQKGVPMKPKVKVKAVKTEPIRYKSNVIPKPVEKIEEEVKFIRRFVLLQNKYKMPNQILSFINQLQRAIIERKIRKESKYARHINFIQENLIQFYKSMKGDGKDALSMTSPIIKQLVDVSGSEKVRLSIGYMKRFVGIHGKNITKEKAKTLHNLIVDAIEEGRIKHNDPYIRTLKQITNSLEKFIKTAKTKDTIEIHSAVLNGLNGVLSGCDCDDCGCDKPKVKKKEPQKSLSGLETEQIDKAPKQNVRSPKVVNSLALSQMEFETIGFMGKWKEFIGDPAKGFTALVYALPKMGKSYLCIDWAGYLARNHGKVLYVAREESISQTLQIKVNSMRVSHPNLDLVDNIELDFTPYDFIFFDSVTSLDLSPEELIDIKRQNPNKSFIYVYQSTKGGKHRGSNEALHNVDIVISIPEKGIAIQNGRFNQGGEMEVFNE